MANKIIKKIEAQSYKGTYENTVNGMLITGSLNANGKKELNSLSGSVNQGEKQLADFNAYINGDDFSYNFNEIHDIESLPAVAAAIKETVAAIKEELKA